MQRSPKPCAPSTGARWRRRWAPCVRRRRGPASHRDRRKDDARQQGRRRPCDACIVGVLRGSAIHSRQRGLRGKGIEIPDALKLLDQLDLKDKIVTGDAMFCQKSIVAKIAEKGGGYVFPVKDNQKNLRENIATAFNEPVWPLVSFEGAVEKAHGRIEQRSIDVLPANAAGIENDWSSVKHICRVTRFRRQEERPMERAREGSRLSDRLFFQMARLRPKRSCPPIAAIGA